ncbi:hypothetical protein GCM10010978_32450 [Compostibacillus humi]|uniref:Asparagine synthetase domain-containing protein n=1 Tax=Compostibacillus humi TaxID=1245525 RepID=A0A8J2TST2_9BACI|nr:hypothetical protein [Compostibacillus humi]GFZ91313.1 hypothetical protein GCM10010978_32450 [Compostibacillus humi]
MRKLFTEYSNYIYAMLVYDNVIKIFNDMASLRTVFYHENYMIIGSHDSLINEALNNKLKQVYTHPNEISFSNLTRYESVRKLIPNMSLEINSGKLERYYPLSAFESKPKAEIKEEIISYLNETVKWIESSTYKPLLSLTGGGDSRMSLAALKPIIDKIETFTYLKNTSNENDFVKRTFENDEKIVTDIVHNLNLNHKFFSISTKTNTKLKNVIKQNVFSNHNLNLAIDYLNRYGGQGFLHIRSTALFNVGKYIFPKETLKVQKWDIKNIAYYLKKWTNIKDDQENEQCLSNLIKYAQLDNFYNHNPLELLFLSYRLIQWHSGVVGESDIAFNTMLLLNSRKVVDLMLSYPAEDRYNNELFYELIQELWPILNYWDVNNPTNLAQKYKTLDKQLKQLIKTNNKILLSLINSSTSQIEPIQSLYKDNGFLFKVSNQNITSNDFYRININLSNLDLKGKIRLKIRFFYRNPKGKGSIFVKSPFLKETRDILQLYGTHEIQIDNTLENNDFFIEIQHKKSTNSQSWVEASSIWIGDFSIT